MIVEIFKEGDIVEILHPYEDAGLISIIESAEYSDLENDPNFKWVYFIREASFGHYANELMLCRYDREEYV